VSEVDAGSFSILTVCTGNLARSPLAAQLLAARLEDLSAISVTSAGTHAHAGDPMTDQAAALSRRFGGQPDGHRATLLTENLVESADLVLTASRPHRAAAVTLAPRAARYVFTLRQFAHLVESVDIEQVRDDLAQAGTTVAERLRALVAAAAAHRGFIPPASNPADDDIDDPFQQSQSVYDRVGAQIDSAVAVIARALVALGEPTGNPHRGA